MSASVRSGRTGGKARVFCGVLAAAVFSALVLTGCGGGGGGGGGGLTDSRDGKKYRTVKIGKLTWMAENLNFKTGNSWCYGDDESNCQKYGPLYDWSTAQNACPAGWRLPAREDWNDLVQEAGGALAAGKGLKSRTEWDGADEFAFSALPGGLRSTYGDYLNIGKGGKWWSATEAGGDDAYALFMVSNGDWAREQKDGKGQGSSVRCVKE